MLTALCAAMLVNRFSYRWVYLQTNLFEEKEVARIEALVRRASKAGYNGIVFADSKLQSLDEVPDFYRQRLNKILDEARADHVEIIPSVLPVGYANGMLAHNPSLIEGIPIKNDAFVVQGTRALPDPKSLYVNGGMEEAQGDAIRGMVYQDGPGRTSFVDKEVKHGGAASLRMENPSLLTEVQGNCRIVQKISVEPWRQYRLRFWVATEGFDRAGSVRGLVLAGDKTVSYTDANVSPTQEWSERTMVFNSLGNKELLVYIGVWGGGHGMMWLDDVSLQDAGLLNVVRRAGCPLSVRGEDGVEFVEGKDFKRVEDPKFGNIPWPGDYDMNHDGPAIELLPGTRIRNGQRLLASFYAPETVGSGQASICLSEPGTAEIEKAEVARVDSLFHPSGFFLSQDEMRVANWCRACQDRGLTPGRMLADDIRRSVATVKRQHPGAVSFVWSDMFDPTHNAVKDYYLVNGPLTGSWLGLSKDTVIVNWNQDKAESLRFFAGRGLKQILAGYYDDSPDSIKDWLKKAKALNGIAGVMYTTWQGKYDDLEAFAKAAWGG